MGLEIGSEHVQWYWKVWLRHCVDRFSRGETLKKKEKQFPICLRRNRIGDS